MFGEAESSHLRVSDFNAGGRITGIEIRCNRQPSACGRICYEIHNNAIAAERPPTPVACDMAEHPMLHLVPLTGAGRKMTDGNLETRFIRKPLQFRLPQTTTYAVTPPTLRGEQQFLGVGRGHTAHPEPPLTERRHRKLRRIMGGAHPDPPCVGRHVINAIRNALASCQARKIIRLNFFGHPLGLILSSPIGKVPDSLLLFGIHGDHGLVPLLELLDPGIDICKLGITIRVRRSFVSLTSTLQTIAEMFE